MRIDNLNIQSNMRASSNNRLEKHDFEGNFNEAYRSKTKDELENYLNEIKKKGNRLIITQNYVDVISYKNTIKDYLQSVVQYMYDLDKNNSFWETNYFTTVETVNKKLEELTKDMMYGQQENLDVASTIDNIQGLLVDIYK